MSYQVMTFQPLGHPMPFESKEWDTKEEAENRKDELQKKHKTAILFVSKREKRS